MCIIFVSYAEREDFPFILAGNRDEYYDRPTAPAARWDDHPGIVAGRDLVRKGTWLGISDSGRIGAVTNYRDPGQPHGIKSRGALVSEFLRSEEPPSEYLQRVVVERDRYTGFNLLLGELNKDNDELYFYSNRESGLRKLAPGHYGLSNHLLDSPWPKVVRGKSLFESAVAGPDLEIENLFQLLQDREIASDEDLPETGVGLLRERVLSPIFIETPTYGTRCSTVVTFDSDLNPELTERIFK